MKIALSTPGKFHTFDLARELYARDALATLFTGYPKFKLKNEGLPQELLNTFPWVQGPYMALATKLPLPKKVIQEWENFAAISFGAFVAQNLPECDLYVGLSGSALPAGKKAHQLGAKFVCDRGSAHIRIQDQLLREEHEQWGLPYAGIDPRAIEREEAEYSEADCITVPSQFALNSFQELGLPANKLHLLPYGVSLSKFEKIAEPDISRFDILFVGAMSLQKGVQYLVQAYQKLNQASKSLTFVGAQSSEIIILLKSRGIWSDEIRILGHIPQHELKNLMSRSHVLVLPSIQDGFGMVMAQAMACGCPVVASANTGGQDLFDDGQEGYVVPIRDVDSLADRLQRLADDPEQRMVMGQRSLVRVKSFGGWRDYGENAMRIYKELVS